ncbi:hypothetical protein ACGFYV_30260 [Streptomyces sp. NPDC048297]|uniref:hypothetical protein n=1 Tax=Streptomyces sp. NPDC048297 TaxID=3365531 RepID=UPI00370FC111
MEHRDNARDDPRAGTRAETAAVRPNGSGAVVSDQHWAADLRTAVGCAAGLLGMLVCVDWAAGSLSWWRCALWLALALVLFLVLFPARVCAGDGWLASRRLLRGHRVRTDLLVVARPLGGVSQRLVLRDSLGARVEIDPEVLVGNPGLWYRLDEGARRSEAAGTLRSGNTALRRLAARIDRETALAVFRTSGLR